MVGDFFTEPKMDSNQQYFKVASHEAKKGEFKKCLLLYSGGLDTSTMLKWIQQEYEADVIALTLDLGQTVDDLEASREKALKLGAVEAIVYDGKPMMAKLAERFIKANADYQGGYALSDPIGRVVISEVAVKIAEEYGCDVIAHGATGKGNDQVRFEGYVTTLNPKLKTIAPVREWSMGREEQIEWAAKNGIEISQTKKKPYSYDENMWGNTGEGGEIENPENTPPLENILKWCNTPQDAPDESETIKIDFEEGIPVAFNDEKLSLDQIIAKANEVGAKHGVGIFNLIEDRFVGLKVRGIYENPGPHILIAAHKKLEMVVSTREENELKGMLDQKWAYLCYAAKWYDPVMRHLEAYQDSQNKKVTGWTKLELYKGNCSVVALGSPNSLFDENLATFEKSAHFNQNSSAGFVELWNLSQKTAHQAFPYKGDLG